MNTAVPLLGETYGMEPEAFVRAPGRVNLIGEHTDYSLLPVLPMAIDRGIDVAGAAADDDVILAISAGHDPVALSTTPPLTASDGWGVYLHGLLAVLGERTVGRGARIAVSGDLPPTGGLSSSSALTVGLLAVLNRCWSLDLGPQEVVDVAIVAERISGVESGGMDQTVIALAESGAALRIDFAPRAVRPVPVPADAVFVIGYSGTPAAKAAGAREHYNRSVVGCRAAAAIIARRLGVAAGDPPLLGRVAQHAAVIDVDELPTTTTPTAAAAVAGVDVATLVALTRASFDADAAIDPQAAARHVLSEAARVERAEAALRDGDLAELGRLFDASHASLRDFGSVTPGLDAVTAAAREAGAAGARVTGAGFGGWAVALCDERSADRVTAAMAEATGGPAFRVVAAGGAL